MDKSVIKHLALISCCLKDKAGTIENIGLLNGKMGIAVFFFLYSKYVDKSYRQHAENIFDDIYEHISGDEPLNYSDGLAGLGTSIEFLARHGFIDPNTNAVLEDLDEHIRILIPYFSERCQ